MSNDVLYQFAENKDGQIIDILELSNEGKVKNSPFLCIGCKNEMIPVLNVKTGYKKYFRHKSNCNCSKESYLHNFSKKKFYQNYLHRLEKGMPFHIKVPFKGVCDKYSDSLGLVCDKGVFYEDVDITKLYDLAFLEKKVGERFIADVLLKSSTNAIDDLLIEIAVTHHCSEEKKKSGLKIIELKVEQERDILKYMADIKISSSGNNLVNSYGLKLMKYKRVECEVSCNEYVFPVYILTNDGYIRSRSFTPAEVSSGFQVEDVLLWKMFQAEENLEEYYDWINEDKFDDDWDKLHYFTREILRQRMNTKACSACKHHRKPYNQHYRLYCMKKKKGLYKLHQEECVDFLRFSGTEDFDGFCRFIKGH